MIDFIYIWDLVNDLFDKYEVTEVADALDNDAFVEELEVLELSFGELLKHEQSQIAAEE